MGLYNVGQFRTTRRRKWTPAIRPEKYVRIYLYLFFIYGCSSVFVCHQECIYAMGKLNGEKMQL